MTITALVASGYMAALDCQNELHDAWIKQSYKMAAIAGIAHLGAIQSGNRLDLLLRRLEAEYEPCPHDVVDFSLDLRYSLAECWVLRMYEVVRAASQQLRLKGEENPKLAALKLRMGVVRMPIAKGEIQGTNKKAAQPIILVYEDGTGPTEYANDGTYIVPRKICADTGSPMWCPVDINSGTSAQVRRIDLSNELLEVFD